MKLSDICSKAQTDGAQLVRPRKDTAGEYDCKPLFTGSHRGWVIVDSFTASAYVQVFNALSETNRAKLDSLPLARAIKVIWSVVK